MRAEKPQAIGTLPVFLLDNCQLLAAAARAHQTGDTQQGQTAGSGNLCPDDRDDSTKEINVSTSKYIKTDVQPVDNGDSGHAGKGSQNLYRVYEIVPARNFDARDLDHLAMLES